MKQFTSGARSSEEAPRYDLIEPAFLDAVARRMAQGAASHGERNYLSGVGDPEFVRDRLNHLVGHVLKLAAGDTSDDHLAAAGANLNMLAVLLVEHGAEAIASEIRESGTGHESGLPGPIPESRTGTSAPFSNNEPPNIPNGNVTHIWLTPHTATETGPGLRWTVSAADVQRGTKP